nr:MAG TPA: hypothetical protein [Caudoviricetes sp.]
MGEASPYLLHERINSLLHKILKKSKRLNQCYQKSLTR